MSIRKNTATAIALTTVTARASQSTFHLTIGPKLA
jgi:hypothetical protein